MDRKNFIKGAGLFGLTSIMTPLFNACKTENTLANGDNSGNCVLIPQETPGPFDMDLSSNPGYFRQNITEDKTGLPLELIITVVDVNNNCSPVTNARVDIWHCDKDGAYSGFPNQPGGIDTSGQTFCRGIQLTNNSGVVYFKTIYPGWYPGRVTHIHFQIYLNNGLSATSQMGFPENITTNVYNTPLYSTRGQNTSVSTNAADGVFGNSLSDLQKQICAVTENPGASGYEARLNVGIAV